MPACTNSAYSIHRVSETTNAGEDHLIELGNFLDSFYSASEKEKITMIADAPLDMARRELVPLLAATAHKLANDHHLKPPDWVFESRCYMPDTEPYFDMRGKGEMRAVLMVTSPPEFMHRNLFVSKNSLSRV
jgi:hypothetical protein